jgi:hypothetical protein
MASQTESTEMSIVDNTPSLGKVDAAASDFNAYTYLLIDEVIDKATDANYWRLYWLWVGGNGGLLDSIYHLPNISDCFPDIDFERFNQRLNIPSNFLSVVSFSLYGFRLSLNLFMLLRHFMDSSVVVDDDNSLDTHAKILTEWKNRKFQILNDIVWGLVNFLSYFWLNGRVSPFHALGGALLNVFLMVFDVGSAIYELNEAKADYEKQKQAIETKLQLLESAFSDLKQKLESHEQDNQNTLPLLSVKYKEKIELAVVELYIQQQQLCLNSHEWQIKQHQLKRNVAVSLMFIPAMMMMFAPDFAFYLTIFSPAAPWILMGGGALALGLTVYQTLAQIDDDAKLYGQYIQTINEKLLALSESETDDHKAALIEKKMFYQQMIIYQKNKKMFQGLLLLGAPLMLLLALNLPIGPMVGVTVVFSLSLFWLNHLIEKQKPTEPDNNPLLFFPKKQQVALSAKDVIEAKSLSELSQVKFGLFKASTKENYGSISTYPQPILNFQMP